MSTSTSSATWQFSILSRDYQVYSELLAPLLPDNVRLSVATDNPELFDCQHVQLALGDPDLLAQVVNQCTQLCWLQSTFAGNAPLLRAGKRDYQLTGVKGIFDQQMREYVFSYLLYFARNIEALPWPDRLRRINGSRRGLTRWPEKPWASPGPVILQRVWLTWQQYLI